MHTKQPYLLLVIVLLVNLPAATCFAQVRATAEAFTGEPFGVGRVVIDIGENELPVPLGIDGLGLSEADSRVFYPAMHAPAVGAIVKDVLDAVPWMRGGPVREGVGGLLDELLSGPPRTTIYFLFKGDGPLGLTLHARRPYKMTIRPRADALAHRQMLDAWWRQYTASSGLFQSAHDYPPMVDNFLATMLACRLNLKLPERKQTESWRDELAEEIGLTLATESVRLAMQQDRLLGLNHLDQQADRPLPEPIRPPALKLPKLPDDVPVEPIAMRVPAECLYIRFGSFNNFLWFQDTLAEWGDDAQNLIESRGLDLETSKRIEEQLVVKQTELSRILGPMIVADVAIIGTDLYMREGAAFGLLFHASSSTALAADLVRQRIERLGAGGVTEQKLTIAGKKVSYLSSADGTVRSYYAADGAYQLVATSKTLVRRFLETGAGKLGATAVSAVPLRKHGQDARGTRQISLDEPLETGTGSLGASDEFRVARSVMPLVENYTAFVYLSDAFFRNMVGPHYRVETVRRLQAAADIDLVQLARLAATAEGLPADTIEQLSGSGILPRNFLHRLDGSRTVFEKDCEVYDSLRGRRGTFLPIPDVEVEQVTEAEKSACEKFAEFYAERFGRIDPTMVGIKRHALKNNRELVKIDARISPADGRLYDFLATVAGEPDRMQLAPVPGDIAAMELLMENQRMFVGLRDFGPPPELVNGRRSLIGSLQAVLVGYIGATGQMPLLGLIENLLVRPPDPRYPGAPRTGFQSRQWRQFTVYSLHPEVLNFVVPRLKFEQAERPAQLRLHVGDPSRARITPLLNSWSYWRTYQTSLGNLRLMHALGQQLHVPAEDCKKTAELLLAARLICPLGGRYVYHKTPGRWTSTALLHDLGRSPLGVQPPRGYVAPPLSWFRGVELDAMLTADAMLIHAEVVMQHNKAATVGRANTAATANITRRDQRSRLYSVQSSSVSPAE